MSPPEGTLTAALHTSHSPSEWSVCRASYLTNLTDPETGEFIRFCGFCSREPGHWTRCEGMTLTLEKKKKLPEFGQEAMRKGRNLFRYIFKLTNVPPRIAYYVMQEAEEHQYLYKNDKSPSESNEDPMDTNP